MAHVAAYKKRIVNNLTKLFKSYPIIGCLNMENLPAQQLQQMRAQLREKVVITMTKRRLIKLAIKQAKDVKGIEKLNDYLLGMPALLFTKEDPFKLNKILQKNKSMAHAKAGQIAPNDITIHAGPTPFAPGPIIGELAQLGLKTGVEANKVVIKEDKIVVKNGEEILPEFASIMSRLDIKPMEIGLNLIAILENGEIIPKDILTVSEEEYIQNLVLAHQWAFNLSIEAGIFNKDNVELLLGKAFTEAKALVFEGNIMSDVLAIDMLSKAERAALNIKDEGNIETDVKEKIKETPKEEVKEELEVKKKEKTEEKPKEEPKTEVKKEEPKVEPEVKKTSKEEVKIEQPKTEEKKEEVKEKTKEKPEVKEKKEETKTEEKPKDETDKKVDSMVKKTKDFAEGKKVTADDLLKDD